MKICKNCLQKEDNIIAGKCDHCNCDMDNINSIPNYTELELSNSEFTNFKTYVIHIIENWKLYHTIKDFDTFKTVPGSQNLCNNWNNYLAYKYEEI